MSERGYNGWSNYETWATALWLDNEEGSQYEASRIVRHNNIDDGSAAGALKEWVEEMRPDEPASLFSDLLTSAMQEIDWQEIAEHFKDDTDDDESDD